MLINTSLYIAGMEQMVRLFASGLAQIGGIKLINRRILMGFAEGICIIAVIENLSS